MQSVDTVSNWASDWVNAVCWYCEELVTVWMQSVDTVSSWISDWVNAVC